MEKLFLNKKNNFQLTKEKKTNIFLGVWSIGDNGPEVQRIPEDFIFSVKAIH